MIQKSEILTKETAVTPKNRLIFIDLAKGICILLVVASHITNLSFMGDVQLRMPLYFMLSGLFFKTYEGFLGFVVRKINKLIVPLFFFYILNYVLFYLAGNYEPDILTIFYNRGWLNGPIWFLLCLFWVNIIFYIIQSNIKNKYLIPLGVIFVGLFGYFIGGRTPYLFYFDSALGALPFFYIGYLIGSSNFLRMEMPKGYLLGAGLLLFGAGILLVKILDSPYVLFAANKYILGKFFIGTYLISTLEVLGVLMICKAIVWLPFVSFFGRYSIITLCLHAPIYQALMYICERFGLQIDDWLYCLAVIVLCGFSIPLCLKFIPHFTAQKNLIKIPTDSNIKYVSSDHLLPEGE